MGIAYNDGATYAGPLVIDGSVTDATHTITLTVDPGNRHSGVPWQAGATPHVVLNHSNFTGPLQILDDYVTVEWLDVDSALRHTTS